MAFDAITYAKSKTYTDETVVGGGAIKGKNCTIDSITPITGGNEVTFKWTLDDGTVQTDTMDVMDGEDGKGIKRVYVNEEDHLIIVYDDDTTSDAGEIVVQSSVDSVNGKTGVVTLDLEDVVTVGDNLTYDSETNTLSANAQSITVDSEMSNSSENPVQNKVITGALADKVDKNGTDSLMTADEHTKLSGIAAGAEVNVQSDWNEADSSSDAYIAHKPNIPTKTSNLTNDSGFIANTVDNLVNYYTKSQTYTQTEVNALISAIVTLDIQAVNTLPTEDISTTTIYLVPSADPQTQNVKDEYINIDGTTTGWELIGSTAIDLSNYVTTTDLATALADYVTSTSLASTLSGYVQKSQTAGLIKNDGTVDTNTYATTSALTDYIQKSQTAGLVKNDGTIDTTTYVSDVSGKADKVNSAVNGNFAGLDSNGNLTDSGKKASDFATTSQAIPTGGTTGQVLKKKSNTDNDVEWSNESGGGMNMSDGAIYDEIITPYLTFSSDSAFTLSVVNSQKNWDGTLEYSTDGVNWTTWNGTTSLSGSASQPIYLRGINNTVFTGTSSPNTKKWAFTGKYITGNIETLLDYQTVENGNHPTMGNGCFAQLFADCTSLIVPPTLGSITLSTLCYTDMFAGCTALNTLPKLPATTLTDYCYATMFSACSNIKVYSTSGTGHTTEYRIPTSGTGTTADASLSSMFTNTGGDVTEPTINTTYYVENEPV